MNFLLQWLTTQLKQKQMAIVITLEDRNLYLPFIKEQRERYMAAERQSLSQAVLWRVIYSIYC